MTKEEFSIGIVGGSGMLGKAISRALLEKRVVAPERLWISNRSGVAQGFEAFPALKVTRSGQELADNCDVVILSVPPAAIPGIAIAAADRLVISVMAGISRKKLEAMTGSRRIIRAMSSPAAGQGLAYSPWCASAAVTSGDRRRVTAIFEACGLTDEVGDEEQIEYFTALTGPVPGFVAFFADAMAEYAVAKGISAEIANRAIRQLFLASGKMMAGGKATPADHVRQMSDYAGTTAAGLDAMRNSAIAREIAEGLDAAVAKSRSIG